VLTVGAAGAIPFTWALWTLVTQPPHPFWYFLAGLALLSGPLSIRIPSMRATVSVSEGFIFTAALLFGPAAATLVAVLDGLVVSLWSRNRSPIRTAFAVGEPAVSVYLASLLFYTLAGVSPLFHQPTSLGVLVGPLLALTLAYFTLNTLLAGTAVWLDSKIAPTEILRQHLPHVALHASATLLLSAALVQTSGDVALATIVVLVPMLLASHLSSHLVAGRLEDTNRHLGELRRLYNATIETLAMAIDAKDQVTHGHIRRVQTLSERLATALGADERELKALEAAALLHDLGKLAVPEHILNKPGPLTPAEYAEMKKHAEVGASILSAVDFPFPVVPIVRHHHENWDGSGYPDGLKGNDIPLGARILSVVDCYDALTSDRPYRRRMPHDEAMDIIRSRSGRTYDPQVVDVFMRIQANETGENRPEDALPPVWQSAPARTASRSNVHTADRAVALRLGKDRRDRVTQFLRALEGASWDEAGRATAAFVPMVIIDAIGVLYRYDSTANKLAVAGLHRGFDGRVVDSMSLGHGITGWVAANRQSMVNADAALDMGEATEMMRPPLRLCTSVSIVDGAELAGVLTVYSPYAFSETDRLTIELVAQGLTAALGADPSTLTDLSQRATA